MVVQGVGAARVHVSPRLVGSTPHHHRRSGVSLSSRRRDAAAVASALSWMGGNVSPTVGGGAYSCELASNARPSHHTMMVLGVVDVPRWEGVGVSGWAPTQRRARRDTRRLACCPPEVAVMATG